MKRIFEIIYYLFLAFVILIALLVIFSAFPITGNYKLFVVQSGSMEPSIKMGSVVIVKPVNDYKIGDVITFGRYDKKTNPVTHRIYDIKTDNGRTVYITKGDVNNAPDTKEVSKKDILGKVLFSVPYFGYMVAFAKKPAGFFLFIIFPAGLIIFDQVLSIIKELKKKKGK